MYNWYHDIRCIWHENHENNCHWDTAFRVRLPSKDTFWCRDCGRVLCDSHRYQHTCERLDALKERNDSWLQQLGRQWRVLNTKSPARSGWSVLLMTHNVVYLLDVYPDMFIGVRILIEPECSTRRRQHFESKPCSLQSRYACHAILTYFSCISQSFLMLACWMVFKPLLYILVCCAPGSSQLPFRHFETWSKAKITKEVRASQRYQRPYLGGMCCIYCQGQSWAALWAVVTTDVFRLFRVLSPQKIQIQADSRWDMWEPREWQRTISEQFWWVWSE